VCEVSNQSHVACHKGSHRAGHYPALATRPSDLKSSFTLIQGTPELANGRRSFREKKSGRFSGGQTEMSDGSGRLALRACQENSPRPSGPCRPAGGVAVCLPGGRRNRLDGHDRGQALQGFAAVRRSVLEGAYGSRSMTGAPIAPGAATPLCARRCESIRPSRWPWKT